jgi:hypothetical protein
MLYVNYQTERQKWQLEFPEIYLPLTFPACNAGNLVLIYQACGGPLMVAQWLRYCATNRKVAGSIPDGVIGFFH